jgi:hypothetical protein
LADILFRQEKKYDKSEKIYLTLIKNEGKSFNKNFATRVFNGYFLSLLYQHKYQEVLDKTNNWEEKENLIVKGILGTYRASAWRRKLESVTSTDEYCEAILSSINIFNKLFKSLGYPKNTCIQAIKLIDDIGFNIDKDGYNICDKAIWLNFIFSHNNEILKVIPDNKNHELLNKLSILNIKNNPFKNTIPIFLKNLFNILLLIFFFSYPKNSFS